MGLADAQPLSGTLPALPSGPPYATAGLGDWVGVPFDLPPGDRRLAALHRGYAATVPAHDNLVGQHRYWLEHPDWMDQLDPHSPVFRTKQAERALYLDRWAPHLPGGARVLDLGGGVGRFMAWLLGQGCTVELVDPDLRSLWRAVSAAGRIGGGALDVHWSTGEALPPLAPVDTVLAVEVLCYAEDPALVLRNIAGALRPGGVLLASVEARWGWAMSTDAASGSVHAFLGDGVVHVPGDRWVRTFDRQDFADLLGECFEVESLVPTHYACSGPFELASGEPDVADLRRLEAQLAAHPVSAPLNRAWTAIARRKPG